jgi:hypothetical protein
LIDPAAQLQGHERGLQTSRLSASFVQISMELTSVWPEEARAYPIGAGRFKIARPLFSFRIFDYFCVLVSGAGHLMNLPLSFRHWVDFTGGTHLVNLPFSFRH